MITMLWFVASEGGTPLACGMDRASTIRVVPIYGWGWAIAGKPRSDVPEPFTVQLDLSESSRWSGIVMDHEHEFHGRRVELSKRHVEQDGCVNIFIEPIDPMGEPSDGFGMI